MLWYVLIIGLDARMQFDPRMTIFTSLDHCRSSFSEIACPLYTVVADMEEECNKAAEYLCKDCTDTRLFLASLCYANANAQFLQA